jgi:uncharacterized integral membrane protein
MSASLLDTLVSEQLGGLLLALLKKDAQIMELKETVEKLRVADKPKEAKDNGNV